MNIIGTSSDKYLVYFDRIKKFSSEIEDGNYSNSEDVNITQLHSEILRIITNYLSAKDIIKLSMVCKQFYIQVTSNNIITKSCLKKILESFVLHVSDNTLTNRFTRFFNQIDKQLCSNDTRLDKLTNFFNQISTNLYSDDIQRYSDDSDDSDLNSNNLELDNFQNFFNHYPIIMYWQSMFNPIKYCTDLPKDNFVTLIEKLESKNYGVVKNLMRNSVWFTLNGDEDWLIKITFKISDDMKELILSIKICSVNHCYVKNFCIESYNTFTVTERDKSYLLKVISNNSKLILPKNELLNKILFDTETKKPYKSIFLRYDISDFKTEHWVLLYEFILKMVHYKLKVQKVPKFYYGDYKHIKNEKIKQLYNNLNLVTKRLSKILMKFVNFDRCLQLTRKKNRYCHHQMPDSDDEESCWSCGRPGGCRYHN